MKTQIFGGEKKGKKNRKRLGRGTLNTCANFEGILSKTTRTLDSEGIWGDELEPAFSTIILMKFLRVCRLCLRARKYFSTYAPGICKSG